MLTQKLKKKFQQMHKEALNQSLVEACSYGHLDIVKYLLTSPDLKDHANIHEGDDESLINACLNGHLEIVKYLLSSPELTEYADIHANNNGTLRLACIYNREAIINYLIFDYRIELTKSIEHDLIAQDGVLMMFNKRTLEEKLQIELQNNTMKNKIKI